MKIFGPNYWGLGSVLVQEVKKKRKEREREKEGERERERRKGPDPDQWGSVGYIRS